MSLPFAIGRVPDEFDSKQKLYAADEETAEVEREGESTESECHLVDQDVLIGRDDSQLVCP